MQVKIFTNHQSAVTLTHTKQHLYNKPCIYKSLACVKWKRTGVQDREKIQTCMSGQLFHHAQVFSLKAKETKTKTFVFITDKRTVQQQSQSDMLEPIIYFSFCFCRLIFSLNVEHLTRKKMTRLMQYLCYNFVSYLQCCPFCSIRFSVKLTWKVPPSVTSQFSENQGYSSNQIF